ncbi:MAG: hypothetical protein NXI31_06440 [bacterium]|nr:hypothetical protein [bacterium]
MSHRSPSICCRFLLALGLAGCSVASAQEAAGNPREFDFWIGEWDVHNRLLGREGFYDAGLSRARIRPILGGKAILEEWDGQPGRHENVFGISVRYWDPKKGRWVIALNWPNPQSASFSHMEGGFRHGRAEFFPPHIATQKSPRGTRFTFSDALPDTVRWDMAQPIDDGGWRTTWIMEFSRTKSAAATVADGEPIRPTPEPGECVCKAKSARQFDALHGSWRGRSGERELALEITSTNRGCATLCFLDVSKPGTGKDRVVERQFEAWAWLPQHSRWVSRAMSDERPEFQVLVGQFDDAGKGQFLRMDRTGEVLQDTRRVTYELTPDGELHLVHEVSNDKGATFRTVIDARLLRR